MTRSSPLVRDYLAELRSTATDRLDPVRSNELVEEIREHIHAAIDDGHPDTDVLRRLGSPAEIVGAELPAHPTPATIPPPATPQARLRVRESAAITLLLIGVVAFGIGWIVGVVVLWTSDRWSARDKLIGTLLWPGGLGPLLFVGATGLAGSSVTVCDSATGCTTTGSSGPPAWGGLAIVVALALVPIVTSIHLARSARVPTTTAT